MNWNTYPHEREAKAKFYATAWHKIFGICLSVKFHDTHWDGYEGRWVITYLCAGVDRCGERIENMLVSEHDLTRFVL